MGVVGDLRQSVENQFDNTPGGGIFDPSESTRELAEATEGDVGPDNQFDNTAVDNQFDDEPGGGFADTATDAAADTASNVRDVAFNIGPDWLDEVAIVGVVVVALGALLWLARPLLGIAEGVSS